MTNTEERLALAGEVGTMTALLRYAIGKLQYIASADSSVGAKPTAEGALTVLREWAKEQEFELPFPPVTDRKE